MLRATFVFVFLVTSLSIPSTAQGPIVIDENDRVILHDNVHPSVRPECDAGRTDPSLRIQMTLVLTPSTSQPKNWRSQQTAGGRIDTSYDQLLAVTSWLRSHGFAVEQVDAGRSSVNFRGTVAQVEKAFRIEIDDYFVDGKIYHANIDDPSVPRALSRFIGEVKSLNDFPMMAGANSAVESILHDFAGTEYNPASGGIMDSAGNLYGTTSGGGVNGAGTASSWMQWAMRRCCTTSRAQMGTGQLQQRA